MADYLTPDARRRIAGGLMAAQYDRATPEDGTVAQRHGLLPLATYDNGQTGLAFPGIVADPLESWGRLLRNGYQGGTGDTQSVEDAFNVAGAAMMGGLAAPKPRNVVGSAGGELKGAALGAVPDMPPSYRSATVNAAATDVPTTYRGVRDSQNPTWVSGGQSSPWWSTTDRDAASGYAGTHPNLSAAVIPSKGNFRNPMMVDAQGNDFAHIPFDGRNWLSNDLVNEARVRGHDGVVIKDVFDVTGNGGGKDPATVVAALKRGTVYSPLTGDLLYANGGRPGVALGAGVNALTDTPGIRAYHGSPHDFDKFDLSKIGTGEGKQAYGRGLYFAENEGVAKSYRDNLSFPTFEVPRGLSDDATRELKDIANAYDGKLSKSELDDVLRDARSAWDQREWIDEVQSAADSGKIKFIDNPGRMYEVNIKANPDDFLDWDKPLSQQSAGVRDAINRFGRDAEPYGLDRITDDMRPVEMSKLLRDPVAIERLKQHNVPGIRYLDQGSRARGEGSRNLVVFDANLIEILKKYGLLGMAGGAAAAEYSGGNSLLSPVPASPRYRPGDA